MGMMTNASTNVYRRQLRAMSEVLPTNEQRLDKSLMADKHMYDEVRRMRMRGINRPDKDIKYESCAGKLGSPIMFGRSTSFLERNRYLPATPKIRTEYPRFHTGFTFMPTV